MSSRIVHLAWMHRSVRRKSGANQAQIRRKSNRNQAQIGRNLAENRASHDRAYLQEGQLHHVRAAVESMLQPRVVLDILQNFTLFATDKKHRRIKIICRYQQYFTTNQMVARVVKGYPKKGLIWHFQGSGKSLLMVFAAQKLRFHPQLDNPTVIIVVDRIDLDTQITATFNAADRNTFWAFGADEDEKGYLSRYSFQDSIRDKATLPLHFEAPEVGLKIDKAAIDEAFGQITGELSEQDRDDLAKRAAKMAVLVKNPERVRALVQHMVAHFQTKIEPNGFKAQVVTFDRECCVLYREVMKVRFPDWQHTSQGERLVQKELRKVVLKYQIHRDQELFDKAYAYVRQYY